MLSCINKSSFEYQSLKNKANIPEPILESVCRGFIDKYNRFPYLDELPKANSEPDLRNSLHINDYNGAKISDILETTGKESVVDANIELNNQYRDLEIKITPLNKEALVDITHRPTEYNLEENTETIDTDNSPLLFNDVLQKLANLYGINFYSVTDAELNSESWRGLINDPVNAFVYNNNIYINTDHASIDAPLHEMMHMFIGSVRFSNPELYQQLVNSASSFPNYNQLAQNYQGRSQNDLNEEIFVTEAARYFSGLDSNLKDMPNNVRYELNYNMRRLLDSILMGKDSVKTISDDRLFNMSLSSIAKEIASTAFTNKFHGTMNVENSELHRLLNNTKADMIKDGTLNEVCE